MKSEERIVKKNPCNMWKDGKEITIVFENAGKQTFTCCYDDRKQKYFHSKDANHLYHSRLFNRKMDVVVLETIYTSEEMKEIALEKYFSAEMKKLKALEVINQCIQQEENQELKKLGE